MEKISKQSGNLLRKSFENTQQWQENLLPFMTKMVLGLTVFFFVASCAQLIYLHWTIKSGPNLDMQPSYFTIGKSVDVQQKLAAAKLRALYDLEAYSLRRHNHLATVLLMARVWTSYLGFVTGMILALVGAAFILGKLQNATADVNAKLQLAELSIKSSSPGLILCSLGVLLMLTTIITHHKIETADNAVYLKSSTSIEDFQLERPPTPKLPQTLKE